MNTWVEIAPGVRTRYKAGTVEIELFGVEGNIKHNEPELAYIDENHFGQPGPDTQVVRDFLSTNKFGVTVAVSYFTEVIKGKGRETDKLELELDENLDLELVVAKSRGEDLPTVAEVASKLAQLASGEVSESDVKPAERKAPTLQ